MQSAPNLPCPEYKVALSAAHAAAQELNSRFRQEVRVESKGIANFVSEADLASESAVIRTIRSAYPDHAIISEESHQSLVSDSEHVWIIDPLDGTNNFLHHIPHFAISIGYYHRGQPIAGVIYNPVLDELYSAVAGHGAWRGLERQYVSSKPRLDDIVVACGFYYDRGQMMRTTLDTLADLFQANVHGMRRFGAASLDLCYIGCGQFGLFFEYKLSPWDYAAGQLFVHEAGGTCTDCDGQPLVLTRPSSVCASNGRIHCDALSIIQPRWRSL
jgi:myo-inositol-1(or 4)-monophosphatase